MLDHLLLLNEEQVGSAIRDLLQKLADSRGKTRKRVALFAEREFPEKMAFEVQLLPDKEGVMRRRAVGRRGPAAVKPVRGSARVGSEGFVAFTLSQVVKALPRVFVNQPGPDSFRSVRAPIDTIVIVTDFIGSGVRVRTMLDKFQNVPSVRSWVSLGLIKFIVASAAGTSEGIHHVRGHRLKSELSVKHVAPTIDTFFDESDELIEQWEELIERYGPSNAEDQDRAGFGQIGALIAFSYGIPNNTPLILHASGNGWNALFDGPAPQDLRAAFGLEDPERQVQNAATAIGLTLTPNLSVEDAKVVIFLSSVRGRWRAKAETSLAEMTGLTVPEVILARDRATQSGFLGEDGRLTDAGHASLKAGSRAERHRPHIPSSVEPYYPKSLRVPRAQSSVRRSSERP